MQNTEMIQVRDSASKTSDFEEFILGTDLGSVSLTSYLSLRGGDIIEFTYNGSTRFGIVVGTYRKPTGKIYTSTRGNQLFSLALLQNLSPGQKETVINILHGNRFACKYNNKKHFESYFGADSFRKFNIRKASPSFLKITKVDTK